MNFLYRSILLMALIGLLNDHVRSQTQSNHFIKIKVSANKFKLIPALDSTSFNVIAYPPEISNLSTFKDSLFVLKSLLGFQGDTSLCFIKPANYPNQNPNMTSYFVPDSANYEFITIEIEALFIFNFIIEPKEFYLASFPRLQEGKFGVPALDKMFGLYDTRLKGVYALYRKWLEECEKMNTFRVGYYPLDHSKYSWL